MRFRRADESDIGDLAGIAEEAYAVYLPCLGGVRPEPMDADYVLAVREREVWVAVTDDEAAGFVVLVAQADHLLLENVAVRPGSQGRGVGRSLLTLAEERAGDLGVGEVRLYTNAVMIENQRLDRSLGYVETGRRKQSGFDRVFFAKVLG